MITCIKNPSLIVSPDPRGRTFLRGKELNEVSSISGHSIICEDDWIADIIPNSGLRKIKINKVIDVKDKVVLPGFVECHTHSVFEGSRASEYTLKLRGATYNEIAASGGGIVKTVNAVRAASASKLLNSLSGRIKHFIAQGVTTLEIKSGYGLDTANEIKMLKVIRSASKIFPIDIIPTFLGAHTIPQELKGQRDKYISLITEVMLPEIKRLKLAKFCDGFCESSAFSANEIEAIFSRASELGYSLRLHTEQFTSIGGLRSALRYKAASVDHLEVLDDSDINLLTGSDTVAVLLPAVSYFLNYSFAPARKIIDNGGIVALATDYNPGSSPVNNLGLIFSLAALKSKMTAEEILTAYTTNAAAALLMSDSVGSIDIGKKADFAVMNIESHNDLPYYLSENRNYMTIKNSKIIYKNQH